jgi:hypothetical protein
VIQSLGYPSGCGQVVYAQDLFLGIAHPGAENFVRDGVVSCALPTYERSADGKSPPVRRLVIGAGEAGDGRRAFLRYIDATRAVASQMIFLVNDWYVQASDLSLARWKTLARVSEWAKGHAGLFRFGRMIGGDPSQGEVYGFAAYDGKGATLALRNPSSDSTQIVAGSLRQWLELPDAAQRHSFQLKGVYGHTRTLAGIHAAQKLLRFELAPLGVAVFEASPSHEK